MSVGTCMSAERARRVKGLRLSHVPVKSLAEYDDNLAESDGTDISVMSAGNRPAEIAWPR